MKLDRNVNTGGKGKYALLKLRNYPATGAPDRDDVDSALNILERAGMLDLGLEGTESEFMVIRLKDKYAYKALISYVRAVENDDDPDLEYAQDILDMAQRAGPNSQWCKRPD